MRCVFGPGYRYSIVAALAVLDGGEDAWNEGPGPRYSESLFDTVNRAKLSDSPMTGEWVMEIETVKHEPWQ